MAVGYIRPASPNMGANLATFCFSGASRLTRWSDNDSYASAPWRKVTVNLKILERPDPTKHTFNVAKSGYFTFVGVATAFDGGVNLGLRILKNEVVLQTVTKQIYAGFTITVQCNAGDTLSLQTISSNAGYSDLFGYAICYTKTPTG